jgi:FlaA1/EpsC-like NDP-sugar epimerase
VREPDEQEAEMLLEDKNAVIYGAGGSIGSAVARAFAASDLARTMTATAINITSCRVAD